MPRLARRTGAFGETIFSAISALAAESGAVNLGQGFPDFAPPAFVLEAGERAMRGGPQQYARGAGVVELVRTIAEQAGRDLGRDVDPLREVTVTVGATEALFAAIMALVDPGEEVVLIEPFYDAYPADVTIAGGVPRYVPLEPDDAGRWQLDGDRLRAAFNSRTKLIVVNTPHNPTGKVLTSSELELIAELCLEHDTLALCDEVYERIVFDGRHHLQLAALPGMWDRTVTVSSVGKTFSVTGWKIGWAVAPAPLTVGIRRLHQWIPFAVATPLQLAVHEVLTAAAGRGYYEELRRMYQGKRDRLVAILARTPLRPLRPEGTYFVIADSSALGDRFGDDVELCRYLTTEVGVAAIPPSPFYCPEHRQLARHLVRFCCCKQEATLARAAERLAALRGGRPATGV